MADASQTNSTGSNLNSHGLARRAEPMEGWSNGELQEVIRNGRMPEIQSIAVCFYSNTTRNLEALMISESSKISRYTASLLRALPY